VWSPHLANPRRGSCSRSSSGRTLIGRLHIRDDAAWLAELLIDLEDDVGEMARLQLIHELRRALP
jgi:hypothetical protein